MGELSGYNFHTVTGMQGVLQPSAVNQIPLTPAPERLTVWRASTPWQTVRSMLMLVMVCFFMAQIAVFIAAGFIDGDLNGTPGPFEPAYTFVGALCLSPLLMPATIGPA